MSLDNQVFSAQQDQPGKIKELFFVPSGPDAAQEYAPFLYVEAKIDFSDVRSGYHATSSVNNVLEMIPLDGDMLWTRDMVRPIDPSALQANRPVTGRLRRLPPYIDVSYMSRVQSCYLSYLMRETAVLVYRNFALSLYSLPGESRDDFQVRCMEMLNDPFRKELDGLHEVVSRRLERIEERYVAQVRRGDFEADRRVTLTKSTLHAARERMAELFLRTSLTLQEWEEVPAGAGSALPDLEQQIGTVEFDAGRAIQRLMRSYQEQVRNIDECMIHPNLRDLHLVRICILWMPGEAHSP